MTRIRIFLLIAILSFSAALASAQVVSVDFNQFPQGQTAETLGIPGVTFASAPASSWITVDTSSLGFASLSGIALFEPDQAGMLDITFSSNVASVSFSVAMSNTPGTSSVKVMQQGPESFECGQQPCCAVDSSSS